MDEPKEGYLDFEAYERAKEPHTRQKAYYWSTAIGLQKVDGLSTSEYLKETAKRNIEGEISIDEAQSLISSYYQSKKNRTPEDDELEEADTPTTTPTTTPTSSDNQFLTDNETVRRLVLAIGNEQLSVRELMKAVNLKDRKNFLQYSLTPAINSGFVQMLHPERPNHPRQKYLLTVKGLALYQELVNINSNE